MAHIGGHPSGIRMGGIIHGGDRLAVAGVVLGEKDFERPCYIDRNTARRSLSACNLMRSTSCSFSTWTLMLFS